MAVARVTDVKGFFLNKNLHSLHIEHQHRWSLCDESFDICWFGDYSMRLIKCVERILMPAHFQDAVSKRPKGQRPLICFDKKLIS